MRIHWFCLVLAAVFMTACHSSKDIKVLQFNIWQEGTVVENGFPAIVENIIALDPDLVTFSEVRNYNDVSFIPHLLSELEKHGVKYYGKESVSTGILSKYEIQSQEVVYPLKNDRGSVIKATIQIKGKEIVLYSAHLDWLNCSSYLPRGYDGCTWKKMEQPIVDVDSILADNRASFRDDEVRAIVEDARKEREQGRIVMIGGDFNEPSHLDWQADTKDIREHRGIVVNWDCSMLLAKDGYKDAFREIYPDPVAYPGFTFPANNPKVDLSKLAWSPEADDRERIDFIYYYPDRSIALKDIQVVGPEGSVLYGERTEKDLDSQDPIIAPTGIWPTDHKALLATFEVK
ncbi:MAG: endonuclease/exonuclease/phosphatase family protein [Parabacteroides sp.]|nr:endonuclease/exonuclease/phosphatase family protein [Parabacteroides sp.]